MKTLIKQCMITAAAVFTISVLASVYVVQETSVTGDSMNPVLFNGESVLVDKISYQRSEPERFDVVVFRYLYASDSYFIKRVVGLPGETIQIIDGEVYVDGNRLEDPYGTASMEDAGRAAEPVLLGEDEYFVLGDNRNYSTDSRGDKVGNVKLQQILGKAVRKLREAEDSL